MKKVMSIATILIVSVMLSGCIENANRKERRAVAEQQGQYVTGQPLPVFDWSLERQLIIELYQLRNDKVTTHAVWRSDYGTVEGDCPSMGFGLPYDTSLTNPLMRVINSSSGAVVEQPEPNGIFASKTTAATWVMCLGDSGNIEPVYVESKVTVYPGPVLVDYDKNRVVRSGAATVMISDPLT